MSTGEGGDAREEKDERDGRGRGGEHIGVGGGDDSVVRIQLAARWAETYSPDSDSLGLALKRFRAAYDYVDAVIHGVEPPDLDRELIDAKAAPQNTAVPEPRYAAPAPAPVAPPEPTPPPQPPESRPWG